MPERHGRRRKRVLGTESRDHAGEHRGEHPPIAPSVLPESASRDYQLMRGHCRLLADNESWTASLNRELGSGNPALASFTPFTEQYAREGVPREVWCSPAFKQVNRLLTLTWGVVFALTAVSGILAVEGSDSTRDFFSWILPIAPSSGLQVQAWCIPRVRARARRRAAA